MSRSDPTGKAYRAALVDVRATVPATTARAITAHVTHLERLLARLQSERSGIESRIRQLIEHQANPDYQDTHFLIVTTDGQPVTMTSTDDINTAGVELVQELLDHPDATPQDLQNTINAASVRLGPSAGPVFGTALTIAFTNFLPLTGLFAVLAAAADVDEGDR